MPIPPTFANAPYVPEDLVFYWEAFHDLHSSRVIAMEEGPIPWWVIKDYAVFYGVTDEGEFYFFKKMITLVDKAYLKIMRLQREQNKKHG